MASQDWADDALSLLAKVEPEKALAAVLPRLRAMKSENQNWAGERKGGQDLLLVQLTEKFGTLPAWAAESLQSASPEDLHAWTKRVLSNSTLEDTLR